MSLLKNVTVNWASVLAPNTTFEPNAWEIQADLSEAQAKALVDEAKSLAPKGIKLKENPESKAACYRFRRKTLKADGTENTAPKVIDASGKPFTKKIGNGSVCNIQYAFAKYDNKFGKGVTCDLKGVQVIKHVPFGVEDGEEFEIVESEDNSNTSTNNDSFDDDDF